VVDPETTPTEVLPIVAAEGSGEVRTDRGGRPRASTARTVVIGTAAAATVVAATAIVVAATAIGARAPTPPQRRPASPS